MTDPSEIIPDNAKIPVAEDAVLASSQIGVVREKPPKKIYKRIFVEPNLCNGCRICELRCSFQHYELFAPSYARIHIKKKEYEGITKPTVCKQCGKPLCIPACPVDAITKSEVTGNPEVNLELCDGCGLCAEACPFDAITFHPEQNYALICDTCGGDPQCVAYCPEDALHFMTPKEYKEYKKHRKPKNAPKLPGEE